MENPYDPFASNVEKAIMTVLYREQLLRQIVLLINNNEGDRSKILPTLQQFDPSITLDSAEVKQFQNLLINGHVKITATELLNYYDCLSSNGPPSPLKRKGPPPPQVWVP